ncbi:MAG: PAS domain-containing protein [Salinarimonadaceae bacterium]|nr:MAG: PAS domain-containing protein [Salinarimonadaceae bacterium]
MNERAPAALRPEPEAVDAQLPDRVSRRGAFIGGIVASAALIAATLLIDGQPLWLFAVAVPAVLAGVAIAASRARSRRRQVLVAADRRVAVAEALLANVPDPVILVDRRSVVREANAAALALFPGLRKRHPLSFGLRAPEILDGVEDVLRTGRTAKVAYSQRVPAEVTFDVQIAALETEGDDGRSEPGVMLFFRDLTNARRLETMRVDFIANVSHELRTPLASVLGFIETLQGPARDDAKARERFLAIMRDQSLRMTRLIDDLLSLSRIELRAHVAPTDAVDLIPVTRQILDTLGPLARENGVTIAEDFPDSPAPIRGDRDELLRVVENLVENAVKYGGSGGKVDVSLTRIDEGGPCYRLAVRDYGPGVSADHLPRLTERFYRADVEQSRQKGGTGLGLAIVKHIVARHRGKLSIESEPGQGATFAVTLPALPAPHVAADD